MKDKGNEGTDDDKNLSCGGTFGIGWIIVAFNMYQLIVFPFALDHIVDDSSG